MDIQKLIVDALTKGHSPLAVFRALEIDPAEVAPDVDNEDDLWKVLVQIANHYEKNPPAFVQKQYISNISKVVELISNSSKIVVIIGAGASVGPDFRSPGGLYDTIAKAGVLSDPYQVFDLDYFRHDPSIFWRFAHTIFPSTNPEHSAAQYFFAELEKRGKLLRLYSQNVDTLEVGIPDEKLRCVHGSWRETRCLQCGELHTIEDLRESVNNQTVPVCKKCGGQVKPGIVFFKQPVSIKEEEIRSDSHNADLLIVVGTSLRVAPVSYLPEVFYRVPSILINREPVTCQFNAELLGDCDAVVGVLENALGWKQTTDGGTLDDFVFTRPNKFVLRTKEGEHLRFFETARTTFNVTPSIPDSDNFIF
ncbi:transcriptional regulator, Sir2 family protein [Histomonas meleagridis]|uniref:transcriptional regulator, Sir2 family protein n=1 Tax=Histomonas meleagridis TaxID=135588 RepID=UPI00355A6190|nr:transcriptional regulator, Sir2 family protein [Histomonas meleagridis]KAH0797393.1 transcriptional regulator, Sir2 family protein [Histomonas meleagridis]